MSLRTTQLRAEEEEEGLGHHVTASVCVLSWPVTPGANGEAAGVWEVWFRVGTRPAAGRVGGAVEGTGYCGELCRRGEERGSLGELWFGQGCVRAVEGCEMSRVVR